MINYNKSIQYIFFLILLIILPWYFQVRLPFVQYCTNCHQIDIHTYFYYTLFCAFSFTLFYYLHCVQSHYVLCALLTQCHSVLVAVFDNQNAKRTLSFVL